MKKRILRVKSTYALVRECLESGARYGINRHRKYATDGMMDDAAAEAMADRIVEAQLTELCERFRL